MEWYALAYNIFGLLNFMRKLYHKSILPSRFQQQLQASQTIAGYFVLQNKTGHER